MAEDIRVVAFLPAKPGQEAAVQQAAQACIEPTRAEPDNINYVLHRDTQHPDTFVFVEQWKSKDSLDRHMQTPHFKTLTAALEGKLSRPMEVHVLAPV